MVATGPEIDNLLLKPSAPLPGPIATLRSYNKFTGVVAFYGSQRGPDSLHSISFVLLEKNETSEESLVSVRGLALLVLRHKHPTRVEMPSRLYAEGVLPTPYARRNAIMSPNSTPRPTGKARIRFNKRWLDTAPSGGPSGISCSQTDPQTPRV